jgi:signal recognition particle GTPase
MPGSDDVEKMICRMLDMGDEELLAEIERTFQLSDERDQRISDTLEEMMLEVDQLISRMDKIEDGSLEDEPAEDEPLEDDDKR